MGTEGQSGKHWILAIDPGVTTGLCHGKLDTTAGTLTVRPEQDKYSPNELLNLLMDAVPEKHEGMLHVIYESFQYRNASRAGLNLTPVKLIGVIELFDERYVQDDGLSHVRLYEQSPATGKAFFRDDRLKELDIYEVGCEHGRDATRHLMQWITFGAGSQYCDMEKIDVKRTGAVPTQE